MVRARQVGVDKLEAVEFGVDNGWLCVGVFFAEFGGVTVCGYGEMTKELDCACKKYCGSWG